jgi:uncharacterized 2Fe-2S/4Fe-4S cluster protein (DUF4445 family)
MPAMSEANLRLALDLGTTTLAGRLLDSGGAVLAESKRANPQAALGSDIIRRLEASLRGEGRQLQALLVEGIEALLGELLVLAEAPRAAIAAAAAAGNPGICILLRNLPAEPILFPPHRPPERQGVNLDPATLGLDLPVPLYLFPLVSGYVGGDLVAFLFGQQPHAPGTFYLDVGTNGEMALYDGERWWTTSVAAGPAFEGGEISCGMPVTAGAVTGVRLEGDVLRLQVFGGGPPRGLAGSGLLEAIAVALKSGLLDASGRIVAPEEMATNLARQIVETPAGRALRLYRDAACELLLSQQDIRSLQLAKGAVRAGVECLLLRSGLDAGRLGEVVMTGAFGFSLAPAVLKKVAMLPANMIDMVRFVPAGALEGVSRLLCDPEGSTRVQALADSLQAYPLSGTPAFEKTFLRALDF